MLLTLSGRHLRPLTPIERAPFVARLADPASDPGELASRELLLVRGDVGKVASGYRGYLYLALPPRDPPPNAYALSASLSYLAAGDVIRVDPAGGHVNVLYRQSSPSNSFLVTERCDNYCVMCSQPPRDVDDAWLVDELLDVIPLLSPETREIGLTGGEPGLLGPRLADLLVRFRDGLPRTAVHVLSNGRAFRDFDLARAIGAVAHPDLMFGIPLYSDLPEEHDYVVQARGAFDDTVRGILNLKRAGVRVELRFVAHADTVGRLREFAAFVARNLLFVDHVALMGLELTGFAKTNLDRLWIDPVDYVPALAGAATTLDAAGLRVSIYNLPLCVLPATLHPFARRSISDWKQAYGEECAPCVRRADCSGFFATGVARRSRAVRPFTSIV